MTIAPSVPADLAVEPLLHTLDAEQRAAATLPDGPALVIAPAGSGKTTTLIARLGVLLARGVLPDRIGVMTFNREAAEELSSRILTRLAPHCPAAEEIEVRTLHAMARQVLLDTGRPVRLLPDRLQLLRAARRRALAAMRSDTDQEPQEPSPEPPGASALDTIVSAWKVEGRPPPPDAVVAVHAFAALMAVRGQIDFDDLVVEAVAALNEVATLRSRWQARFSHMCVDEFQDVDAAQLRLVRILAAPEDNLFVVGDDDQPKFDTRTYTRWQPAPARPWRTGPVGEAFRHYLDPIQTETNREIDVFAWMDPSGPVPVVLVFECRAASDKPWVVLTSDNQPGPTVPIAGVALAPVLSDPDFSGEIIRVNLPLRQPYGFTVVEAYDDKNDRAHAAMEQAIGAAVGIEKALGRDQLLLAMPVVVTEAPLYRFESPDGGEDSVIASSWERVCWNGSQAHPRPTLIDLVSREGLRNYLGDIRERVLALQTDMAKFGRR